MKHFFYVFFLLSLLMPFAALPVHAEEASVSATPMPAGPTTIEVTLLLHGIGQGGDSVNQTPGGTTNPIHTNRSVTVSLYDDHKNLVATKEGTIIYDATTGSFKGSILFDKDCPSGTYVVVVNTDRYLKQILPGQQTITAGTTTLLPSVSLVAGDANNDEYLDIVDYSIVIGCFSELMPAAACNDSTKVLGDITDDGVVNQFDYNLFLRELTKQPGR
jgi:hypothetical protein